MNQQEERKQIWRECLELEQSRDPRAFYQNLSFEGEWCINCGYIHQKEFKKEERMTKEEKILWQFFQTLPGYPKKPEPRKLRLSKSNIGVWCFVCEKCTPMLPKDWE